MEGWRMEKEWERGFPQIIYSLITLSTGLSSRFLNSDHRPRWRSLSGSLIKSSTQHWCGPTCSLHTASRVHILLRKTHQITPVHCCYTAIHLRANLLWMKESQLCPLSRFEMPRLHPKQEWVLLSWHNSQPRFLQFHIPNNPPPSRPPPQDWLAYMSQSWLTFHSPVPEYSQVPRRSPDFSHNRADSDGYPRSSFSPIIIMSSCHMTQWLHVLFSNKKRTD